MAPAAAAWVAVAALNAAMAVAFGAYASHGLAGQASDWARTASQYQMWHALALLPIASGWIAGRAAAAARWAFLAGIALFCGSLYALALGAPRGTAALAPLGGLTMILGWLLVAAGALVGAGRR
ncbi:DUF423 domain-containing protein [Arenibaculum pallidiluteum]|uniref:DUF423 domain-containing protein n=1 Tax=Arenibaculum pallidiluteum TaxID=2812559 RepID=UPI001A959679|nr:DUF423 domain-containing protein [Arenibaculum pallidiluteum]